jgi:hypothetical protein
MMRGVENDACREVTQEETIISMRAKLNVQRASGMINTLGWAASLFDC